MTIRLPASLLIVAMLLIAAVPVSAQDERRIGELFF